MKCPCCKVDMIRRDGRFGEFFYCKDHGTMSNQGGKVVATGVIKEKLRERANSLQLSRTMAYRLEQPSLLMMTEQQTMGWGVRMDEIDRFIEGETLELMQLQAQDDEDHWLNTRPY